MDLDEIIEALSNYVGTLSHDEDGIVFSNRNTLYHLAGDSIVVPVLMALFGQMLDVQKDWWFNGDPH